MRVLRNIAVRYVLLNKRLFRKISFIVILCAVPLLILALEAISSMHGGIVTVALVAKDASDPVAREVIDGLVSDPDSVVRFTVCETADQAADKVRFGKADGAWIFENGLTDKIADFASDPDSAEPCVRIVEREDTVALKLAREKLSGLFSGYFSRALMQGYAKENFPEMADMTQAEFDGFFDRAFGTDDLFEFSYAERGESADDASLDILMLPARGLLSVMIVLGGLATAMFYMRDESEQTFYRLPPRERPIFAFGYQLTGIIDVAVVVVITLAISGITVSVGREIASMAVFCIACAAFCILVRRICGKLGRMAAVTPLLIVALIAVSPIFFTMAEIRPVQLLTPTYYYLMSIHSSAYIGYTAIYAAVLCSVDYAIYRITDRA